MEAVDRNREPECSLSVPVIAEDLEIEKRKIVTGSVRITKSVKEREQTVDVPVLRSTVLIERVPIGQVVDEPPSIRREGENTTIYPVVEEIVLVTRKYLLKEEIRITRQDVAEPRSETYVLRTEEVVVERQDSSSTPLSEASSFLPFTEGVIHVTETAEEPVITKRARVIEEVNLHRNTSERTVKIEDTVRSTEISVESFDGDQKAN